jgi:hypothetical protein
MYKQIMYGPSSSQFQLPWLIGIIQWGALLQAIQWFCLIWVYRLTLKGLRKDETGKLILLAENEQDLEEGNVATELSVRNSHQLNSHL